MIDFFSLSDERRERIVKNFKAKFTQKGHDDCWIWEGWSRDRRYGCIMYRYGERKIGMKATIYAHRLAWMIEYNTLVPKGLLCCHTCDNTKCVNPRHIFLATKLENARDCARKDRRSPIKRAKRIEIIRKVVEGLSLKKAAKLYNISISTVFNYIRRQDTIDVFGRIDLSYRYRDLRYRYRTKSSPS